MAYVHKDYAVEVEVDYTPPPATAQRICLSGSFVLGHAIPGTFKFSVNLSGSFIERNIQGSFEISRQLTGSFQLNHSLKGTVPECD